MGEQKIVLQVLTKYGSYDIDNKGDIAIVGGGNAGGYGISMDNKDYAYNYLLGLLNSTLLNFYIRQISTTFRGGYYSYAKRFIEKIPIRTIDQKNPDDKIKHDKMVELVETMLSLNKKLNDEKSSHTKEILTRQIEATDRQIDTLVYDLYNLTEGEIQIVEDSFKK